MFLKNHRTSVFRSWRSEDEPRLFGLLMQFVEELSDGDPCMLDLHPFVERPTVMSRLDWDSALVLRRSPPNAIDWIRRVIKLPNRNRPVASICLPISASDILGVLAAPALWDASFVLYRPSAPVKSLPNPHLSLDKFLPQVRWSLSQTLLGLDWLLTASNEDEFEHVLAVLDRAMRSAAIKYELLDSVGSIQIALRGRVVDLA